jgi:glycosyltransferase involved in cell wall biosynthesis
MADSLLFSVVIPAFNEELNIVDCLECLLRQTLPSDRFEVIVADNGSTDRTAELARGMEDRLPLRVLSVPKETISALRNRGAALANGQLLAFLDADCLPEPDWLAAAAGVAAEQRVWGADYLVPRDATWVGKIWVKYQMTEHSGPVAFLPGGCLFMTTQSFAAIGGFNAAIETSEDVELCSRARQHGYEVLAFPQLAVYHEGTPRRLKRFFGQNRWHGKHVMRAFWANFPTTRNIGLIGLTAFMLLAAVAVVLSPLLLMTQHPWLVVVPAVLLCAPPLALALRKTARGGAIRDTLPLFALYLVYLLARARAMVDAMVP